MEKIKKKSGFTLVECIVAMAVFSIMALLLMMILSVAVTQKNKNIKLEHELDEQVNDIAEEGDVTATPIDDTTIIFKQGDKELTYKKSDGSEIKMEIPKDGVDNLEADKITSKKEQESNITSFKYDFGGYTGYLMGTGSGNGEENGGSASISNVYGGAEVINKIVQIHNVEVKEFTKTDGKGNSIPTKSVTLKAKFSVKNNSEYKAVKIALPVDAVITENKVIKNATVLSIAKNVIRIEPSADGDVEVDFTFEMEKNQYDAVFKNVKYYFEGTDSTASPANAEMNKEE